MMGYQLKFSIKDSHPPIWRRILVPDRITFFDLDDIIEAAFGWQHDHLFSFIFGDLYEEFMGTPSREESDTANACIDEWMQEGKSFRYVYDFGDDWVHTIKVEKVLAYEKRYPQVIKYKGPNMIEDCGGIWGFYECIEEAEPFDMEALNERFQKWNLKESYPDPLDYSFGTEEEFPVWDEMQKFFEGLLNRDKKSQEEMEDWIQFIQQAEMEKRKSVPPIERLEDVYSCYTKDELKQIAQLHGFTGYNKFKKKELAQWLKNHVLETAFMKKMLLEASEEAFQLLESAIEEGGISITESLVEMHLLLATYGGFNPDIDFYQVPEDVREKYKQICTPQFRQECITRQRFLTYCDAALYLYGVLPLEKFVEIYNSYENAQMNVEEASELIWDYIERGEMYVLKDGLLMDADLEEENMFQDLMEAQDSCPYYIPEDKEEFLAYGQYDCQKPDKNMDFFFKYLHKKLHKREPEDLMIYYEIQNRIHMNEDIEELISVLLEFDCKISSDKQILDAIDHIMKLGNYIRKWEYRGHTNAEIQKKKNGGGASGSKIISFPGSGKIYPNDPCPCGSGKKYKHCCGKRQ